MEYTKPWLSIDEQIDLLAAKGLVCRRDDLAEKLREVGYYRLSAYWFPYKVRHGDGPSVFAEGTSFETIWRTYQLDCDLRRLMFNAVSRIEVFLRGQLAYRAAQVSGPFGYPEQDKSRLIHEYRLARTGELYVRHFENVYGDSHELPPYWMMVEASTMGTIEALYRGADSSVRIGVADELGVKVPVFKNWLSVLRVARNACCHHSRVWNRIWGVKPAMPKAWGAFSCGNDRTFAVLTVINYMLCRIDSRNDWVHEVEGLLVEYENVDAAAKMGFPDTWRELPGWSRTISRARRNAPVRMA